MTAPAASAFEATTAFASPYWDACLAWVARESALWAAAGADPQPDPRRLREWLQFNYDSLQLTPSAVDADVETAVGKTEYWWLAREALRAQYPQAATAEVERGATRVATRQYLLRALQRRDPSEIDEGLGEELIAELGAETALPEARALAAAIAHRVGPFLVAKEQAFLLSLRKAIMGTGSAALQARALASALRSGVEFSVLNEGEKRIMKFFPEQYAASRETAAIRETLWKAYYGALPPSDHQ